MDRRTFLKSVGVAAGTFGAGGVLAACGDDAAGAIPTGQPTLNLLFASFEALTGPEQPVAFGLITLDNVGVRDADDLQVYVREVGGPVLSGPHPAAFHDDTGAAFGVYTSRIDFDAAGTRELVVVRGDDHGTAAFNVVAPADSVVPVAGDQAISVPTPTTADDLGIAALCTQDPPCSMHEVSLDAALADGRPIALLFSTPAYCQSAICGPSVGAVERTRDQIGDADVAFIHVEIFSDAGITTTEPVEAWGLRSEPWLFTIDAAGAIAGRLDGPMVPEMVSGLVAEIGTPA